MPIRNMIRRSGGSVVALSEHGVPDIDGTTDRLEHAVEDHEQRIAGDLDKLAAVPAHSRVDQFATHGPNLVTVPTSSRPIRRL